MGAAYDILRCEAAILAKVAEVTVQQKAEFLPGFCHHGYKQGPDDGAGAGW